MKDLTPVVDKILNQPAEKNIPYQELTGKIIGCAMKILNYYGPWYVEYVYQKGLEHLLRKEGIAFTAKDDVPIYYEGELTGATLKPDLFVDGKVIVELKAIPELLPKNDKQLLSYLKATQTEVGLLINFGQAHIQIKRLLNTPLKKDIPDKESQ